MGGISHMNIGVLWAPGASGERSRESSRSLGTLSRSARVMVEPSLLSEDDHVIYVSGNDAAAKAQVTDILRNWFGWRSVVDLGNITTARAAEMVLPLWLALMRVQGTPLFNFKIVH